MAGNIRPIEIPLPITKEDLHEFSLPLVPKERTFKTLKTIYGLQRAYSCSIIFPIIIHLLGGLIMAYIFLIFFVLSLFNVILFLIIVGLLIRYFKYSRRNVKYAQEKKRKVEIAKFLDNENRCFYSKKLIRWAFDREKN